MFRIFKFIEVQSDLGHIRPMTQLNWNLALRLVRTNRWLFFYILGFETERISFCAWIFLWLKKWWRDFDLIWWNDSTQIIIRRQDFAVVFTVSHLRRLQSFRVYMDSLTLFTLCFCSFLLGLVLIMQRQHSRILALSISWLGSLLFVIFHIRFSSVDFGWGDDIQLRHQFLGWCRLLILIF
jgi:hypothetical protein